MEPASSSAAGFGAYKAGAAIGGGVLLSAIVVMAMAAPKSKKEVFVALVCTLASSLFGGSALVAFLGFQHWATEPFGLMGIGGIMFICGMPGWVLVRAFWHWADVSKDKTLLQMWQELRGINK